MAEYTVVAVLFGRRSRRHLEGGARGTVQGDLGIAAKVVPDEGDSSRARVICIYTKNFTDIEDIRRVAKQMKELGLITTRGRPAHYKCGKLCLSL